MEKAYNAIGGFYNAEGTELAPVPEDMAEVVETVEDILSKYGNAAVISDEDAKILRSYLPAIGSDEAGQDGNGALIGRGVTKKTVSGCGVTVEAEADLEVSTQWEQYHDRKQWKGIMKAKKIEGIPVRALIFNFKYVSICQNAEGKFYIFYCRDYERVFNDPRHVEDFNNGGTAEGSRIEISKGLQWGFYMSCKISVRTAEGTLVG